MERQLILLFNHNMTETQYSAAKSQLGVKKITEPPQLLKKLWANIPPNRKKLHPLLEPVFNWLQETGVEGDYVLIQGDFGACYLLVNFAKELGLVPVYSTTDRYAAEHYLEDGGVKLEHVFRHVIFRHYDE